MNSENSEDMSEKALNSGGIHMTVAIQLKSQDLRERGILVWPFSRVSNLGVRQRVVRPKSVIKFVSESLSIRRACAYISRRFTSVFWRGFFFETQSAFLIGLESAEGYPLAVDDSPKTREIPKNIPYHDVFMGTLPSSRRGKRVTLFGGQQHPHPTENRKQGGKKRTPIGKKNCRASRSVETGHKSANPPHHVDMPKNSKSLSDIQKKKTRLAEEFHQCG
ncbi:hypothetical protein TNCV_2093931 [Trichonephila clavipes]|nr:hypothetical protein TNCV_2093931 [Trichonephila clavipes]